MKRSKSILSIVLTLCMIVSLFTGLSIPASAQEESTTEVADSAGLIAALANPVVTSISITADIIATAEFLISRSVNINGNGHTVSSSDTSVFHIGGAADTTTNLDDVTIDLNHIKIVSTTANGSPKGIHITNLTNSTLVLDNIAISGVANMYAVYFREPSAGNTVTISNSNIAGWAAVYVFSDTSTYNITNSTLTGTNVNTGDSNEFATIEVQKRLGTTGGDNNTINVSDSTINAYSTNAVPVEQFIADISYGASGNNMTFTGCTLNPVTGFPVFNTAEAGENNTITVDGVKSVNISTADALIAALSDSSVGNIYLTADITATTALMPTHSVNIYGNNNTITSSAPRIFNLSGSSNASLNETNAEVGFYDVNLVSTSSAASDRRGISLYNLTGTKVVINHVSVSGNLEYALNVAGTSTGLDVIISYSELSGWAAINSYSSNSIFTITNSTLTGSNDKLYSAENDFATIIFYDIKNDPQGNGQNNTITVTNSTVTATQTTGNSQYILALDYLAGNNVVNFTGCTLSQPDGQEVFYTTGAGENNTITVVAGSEAELLYAMSRFDDVTVEIASNITITSPLTIAAGVTLTLDLDGHTLSYTGGGNQAITVLGTLILTGGGTLSYDSVNGILNQSANTVYLNGIAVTSSGSYGGADIVVEGGTVYVQSVPAGVSLDIEVTEDSDVVSITDSGVGVGAAVSVNGADASIDAGTTTTYYGGLQTAVTSAEAGQTVVLEQNIELGEQDNTSLVLPVNVSISTGTYSITQTVRGVTTDYTLTYAGAESTTNPNAYAITLTHEVAGGKVSYSQPLTYTASIKRTVGTDNISQFTYYFTYDVNLLDCISVNGTAVKLSGGSNTATPTVSVNETTGIITVTIEDDALTETWAVGATNIVFAQFAFTAKQPNETGDYSLYIREYTDTSKDIYSVITNPGYNTSALATVSTEAAKLECHEITADLSRATISLTSGYYTVSDTLYHEAGADITFTVTPTTGYAVAAVQYSVNGADPVTLTATASTYNIPNVDVAGNVEIIVLTSLGIDISIFTDTAEVGGRYVYRNFSTYTSAKTLVLLSAPVVMAEEVYALGVGNPYGAEWTYAVLIDTTGFSATTEETMKAEVLAYINANSELPGGGDSFNTVIYDKDANGLKTGRNGAKALDLQAAYDFSSLTETDLNWTPSIDLILKCDVIGMDGKVSANDITQFITYVYGG